MQHQVLSRDEWLKARLELVAAEKEFTRQRDALTRRRMAMPWERVDKSYRLEAPNGTLSLADLFDGRSQLIVYHFMFAPDWEEGCKSCSFWADNFNGIPIHLNHRDVRHLPPFRALRWPRSTPTRSAWAGASRGSRPTEAISPSTITCRSHRSRSPTAQAYYNYAVRPITAPDEQGVSVFYKDESGEVFHTYSCHRPRHRHAQRRSTSTSTLCPRAAMRTASTSRWRGSAGTISIRSAGRRS